MPQQACDGQKCNKEVANLCSERLGSFLRSYDSSPCFYFYYQEIPDPAQQKEEVEMVSRRSALFDSIFDVKVHEALRARGERRWSHRAFQGALMVSFYRWVPRTHVSH